MARKKIVAAQTEVQPTFQPKRLDEFATQISPELVVLDGLEEPVPLEEYLQNREQELQASRILEGQLYTEIKNHIRRYLPVRTGTWQEDCRKLSWSYAANGDPKLLRQVVTACPSMAIQRPRDSVVTAHHLSHLIRAFLATVTNLPPLDRAQAAPCLVYPAESESNALQLRIIVWKHLLQLLSPEQREVKPSPSKSILTQILEQQKQILDELQELRTLLQSKRKV